MSAFVAAIGRILIALLFIVSGAGKLMAPADAATAFTNAGMSQSLVVPVGLFEVVAGACLAIGVLSGLAATALAVFTALTILFVHNQFADPAQQPVILSHVALIGGLVLVIAHRMVGWQVDRMRLSRERDKARIETDAARHDAELRAARAEALAQGRAEVPPAGTTVVTREEPRVVAAKPVLAPAGTVPVETVEDGYARPRRWYQVW
ncbi:MAG: DoxX family protein [Novosphingobium sp.]